MSELGVGIGVFYMGFSSDFPNMVPDALARLGGSSQKKLDFATLQFLLKCVHKCIFKDGKIEGKKSVSNFFDH